MSISSNTSGRLRVAAITALLVGIALWRFAPDQRLDLLSRIRRIQTISDRLQGGISNSHVALLEHGIRLQYALGPMNRYPWAGINLRFADSSQPPLDLTAWSALEVRTSATNRAPLRIQLLSDDRPQPSGPRDSTHLLYHIVEYTPLEEPHAFPWADFQIPSWWRDQNQRGDLQRIDLLDRLRSIEFHNGFTSSGPDSSSIDILELNLVGPNRFLRGLGILLGLAGGFVLLIGMLPTHSGTTQGGRAPIQPSASGSIVLDDPRSRQRESVLNALKERFPDPELSLESFASSQGMSPRLVATLLKEATTLHFKGILNELRLNEAARLLKENRANISEIAFAVGFQNASHFGRAFRERFGCSPSEFRSENQPPAAPSDT